MFFTILNQIEIGTHIYLNYNKIYHLHAETIFVSALILIIFASIFQYITKNLKQIPNFKQNVLETFYHFIENILKQGIKSDNFFEHLPLLGAIFFFILNSNILGSLLPWQMIKLASGGIAAPTNDINTTICLALLISISYFRTGFKIKGIRLFKRYIKPNLIFLPINILEDFTKPLSLNFRLLGNVLADELIITVISSLVPLFIPIPMMFLCFFTGSLQALIFITLASAYIGEFIE